MTRATAAGISKGFRLPALQAFKQAPETALMMSGCLQSAEGSWSLTPIDCAHFLMAPSRGQTSTIALSAPCLPYTIDISTYSQTLRHDSTLLSDTYSPLPPLKRSFFRS